MAQVLASARGRRRRQLVLAPDQQSPPKTVAGFNVYGDDIGGFSEDDEELCETFAAKAPIVVFERPVLLGGVRAVENLSKAMESRSVIEQAKGVLMSTASHRC